MDEITSTPLDNTGTGRILSDVVTTRELTSLPDPNETGSIHAPAPTPFVRQRAPRRTIEAIDDLAEDDNPTNYTHESDIAVGGMVSDGSYRRARAQVTQFQRNNRYGQYLEVPKGRRSIFAKQERKRRRQSAIAALVVVGLLAVVAYVVWQLMSRLSLSSLILGGYVLASLL